MLKEQIRRHRHLLSTARWLSKTRHGFWRWESRTRYYLKTWLSYELAKFLTTIAPPTTTAYWGGVFTGPRGLYYEWKWHPDGGRDLYELINEISPQWVCVDIGAWIGMYSIYMARTAKKVIAVEPDRWNASFLKKNIKLNHASDRIEVLQAAISDKDGMAMLRVGEVTAGHSLTASDAAYSYPVKTISLDTLLANIAEIDLIKMDIQGAEYDALKSFTGFHKVRRWVIECHTDLSKQADQQAREFMEQLFAKHGYSFRWLLPVDVINANSIYAYR